MAISRMQQPRQMYGLGSFVKKAVGKVTKPFTKVAKKLVPKEIAGIMRAAAPFLPAGYREAAYLLGTAKQTGRISPIDLALTAAPTIANRFRYNPGQGISFAKGAEGMTLGESVRAKVPGGEGLMDFLVGSEQPAKIGRIDSPANVRTAMEAQISSPKTTMGIFGKGGDFDITKGSLLRKADGSISGVKAGAAGVGLLSFIQNSKTPEDAGNALAQATGNSDDYDRGYQLFSQLKPELFEVPQQFRLPAQGGGLMRTNYAIGSDDEPLKPDPTKPINPFGPKPTGPVLPDRKASVDDPFYRNDYLDENAQMMFGKPYKELNADELEEFKEEMMRLMNKFSGGENNRVRELLLKEETEGLTEDEKEELRQLIKTISAQAPMSSDREGIMMAKEGGRANLALGTKPTTEESGLGGLPIEADMRYTGGFMPYGAKEKADDVPARLSKNEFVFTADAVRAAGGGSVNEGAKKMYQAMKQLEKKPEAKGMMA